MNSYRSLLPTPKALKLREKVRREINDKLLSIRKVNLQQVFVHKANMHASKGGKLLADSVLKQHVKIVLAGWRMASFLKKGLKRFACRIFQQKCWKIHHSVAALDGLLYVCLAQLSTITFQGF